MSLRLGLAVVGFLAVACSSSKSGDDDDDDDGNTSGLDDTGSSADDTSANNQTPYGPENTWWHAWEEDLPADLQGTGYSNGDIAYNFTGIDQYGDPIELYQFYGQVIVLDVFAEW